MSERNHRRNIGIGLALAGLAAAVTLFLLMSGPEKSGVTDIRERSPVEERGHSTDLRVADRARPLKKEVPLPKGSERTEIQVLDIAESAAQLHQSEIEPVEDLMILENLLSYYRRIYGANPEGGLNFEIVAKLTGKNDRNVALLTPNHPSLNADGELEDRWGTPYWFHPVSRDLMEIVSAGPDKHLWTEDDVRIE